MSEPTTSVSEIMLLLLPLMMIGVAMIFVIIAPFVMYMVLRLRPGVALGDRSGPINVAFEEQLESSSTVQSAYQRWLEQTDDATRAGFECAARWCQQNPPRSQRDTDITMPQFLGIQEKGVSAWSFDPPYEDNQGVYVSSRTEIQFLADSVGMAPEEGGACSIQSNLPLPKQNEVYYWEAKMFNKPSTTNVVVGLSTKPYPSFRAPGLCKHSVGYFSQDGSKCYNHPFHMQSYGPAYVHGDVIGVGYRPRSGSVFFTRNGMRISEAFLGLYSYNLFPTVSADGPAEIHVNFGQAGFVFIEANVKRWGLAPMVGTLAPPPAYGQDKDSILIESAYTPSSSSQLRNDVATEELVRVPSYDASVPDTETPQHDRLAAQGICMATLRPSQAPPPYSAALADSCSPPPQGASGPPEAPSPAPIRGAIHALHGWFHAWHRLRRDTSAGTPEVPSTELVGVLVD
ncbi:Protein ssh4 [Malassezia equina]|uniref:Protein ssh4 n=1 Tax=Malassezia equina TaxID=1381935 RepID=A0AAF0EHZ1_9BASI|nr:Protein ssh4 [Malassezia equina]